MCSLNFGNVWTHIATQNIFVLTRNSRQNHMLFTVIARQSVALYPSKQQTQSQMSYSSMFRRWKMQSMRVCVCFCMYVYVADTR